MNVIFGVIEVGDFFCCQFGIGTKKVCVDVMDQHVRLVQSSIVVVEY